jgi:hypothetical protein
VGCFLELSSWAQCELEAELIQLHPQDGISILLRVEKLKCQDSLLAFKSCNDLAPEGLGLDPDAFILIIQCPYQQEMSTQLGNIFVSMDATYNTTQSEYVSLFTVLVQDRWGHGEKVALYIIMSI